MIRRRFITLQSKQFGDQFRKTKSAIGETDVKVAITPRSIRKKNKFAFPAASEESFWEELKQSSMVEVKKIPQYEKKSPIPTLTTPLVVEKVSLVADPKDSVIVSSPKSSPIDRYLERGQDLLRIRPDCLIVLQNLVKAKDATDVLLLLDERSMADPLSVSTALHRVAQLVAKKGSFTHIQVIKNDARFFDLLEMTENTLQNEHDIGPVFLSNVFWALIKLDIFPETLWAEKLVDKLLLSNPAKELIGSNLFSIAELEKTKRLHACSNSVKQKINQLKDLQISIASSSLTQETEFTLHELVSVCTSLARLGRVEKTLLAALSDSVKSNLNSISMEDLTSVLYVFTALKLTDSGLFAQVLQTLEAGRVRDCSKRNLVDIGWSLAKSRTSGSSDGFAVTEFFKFCLSPLMRQHLMEYSVRELCTILWSFASAEVVDLDFYNDLSHALIPKIDQMNAHDVSSVAWAMGSAGYMNKDLFSGLKHQALMLKSQLSPLQLSRVIYGLGAGGVKDKHVLTALVAQAKNCMHSLYMQNIMDILIGLQRVDFFVGVDPLLPFLKTLGNNTEKLSGRDAVQLLGILGELEQQHKAGISHDLEIIEKLESIVAARFNCSGRWIPNGFDLVDLVKGLADLDSRNTELSERVILHISTLYKSPSFTSALFLRFLHSLSLLAGSNESQKRLVCKLLLLKERGIQTAMEKLSEQLLVGCCSSMSLDTGIEILDMYARLGYADAHVVRFAEDLSDLVFDAEAISCGEKIVFLRSLAQLQLLPDAAFALAEKLCPLLLSSPVDLDLMVDYVWSRLALADAPELIPIEIFLKIGELYEQDCWAANPKNLIRAQQVAVSCTASISVSSPQLERFLTDMSSFFISGGKSKAVKKGQKLTRLMDKYESFICHSLAHSGVKHQQNFTVFFYSVTASVGPKNCIDLVGATDAVTPEGVRWTGEKILRNLHLAKAGWKVKNVKMREIQKALDRNSLHSFVSDLLVEKKP